MRLTVAQALVRYLAVQSVSRDGRERPFFAGCLGILGHGNIAGLGQALQQHSESLPYIAARNEQVDFIAAVSRKEAGAYKPGQNGTLEFIGPGDPIMFTNQNNWSGLTKVTYRPTSDQTFKFGYVALKNSFSTGQGLYTDTNDLVTQTATADYSWKPGNPFIDLSAKLWWSSTDNHQYRPARPAYPWSCTTWKLRPDARAAVRAATPPWGLDRGRRWPGRPD